MAIGGVKPLRGSAASQGQPGMLFSLSVDDSPLTAAAQQVELSAQLQLLEDRLSPCLGVRGPFHRKLLRDVHFYRDILLAEEGDVDGVVLASKLTLCGYRVAVRQALGGGQGTAVFSNLRHSFLLVTAPSGLSCAGTDYIVEPHFREQFEISHPSARYSGLLSMVPPVFVGTAEELTPLVQLLCSEMSLAFEQHGLSLPPWRQSKSLISKWLPSKLRDYDLSPYASPRAASPEQGLPLSFFAAVAAHGSSHPASEAASGSITPAFSGGEDDSSPRAVLHCASAVLSQQAAAVATPPLAAGPSASSADQPAAGPRKSLLSSSLAATGRRSPREPVRRGPVSDSSSSGSSSIASQKSTAQLVGSATLRHASGAMLYRVSSEWQQPAIRTVKMQGTATPLPAANGVPHK